MDREIPESRECEESQALTRRRFLAKSGATALLSASLQAWFPRVAFSQVGATRDVLVFIYMRGGADGLTLCAPYQESELYRLRPSQAIPPPGSASIYRAIDLDGFFGFPQPMRPLMDAFQAGHLLPVHAVGLREATRSHFTAQFRTEAANGAEEIASGWVGRHLATSPPMKDDARLRGLAFDMGLPFTMNGGPRTVSVERPTASFNSGLLKYLPMYESTLEPVRTQMRYMGEAIRALSSVNIKTYVPGGGAVYPTTSFGNGLKAAAALITADIGVEAIEVDMDRWDTHNAQGSTTGFLASHMAEFASSLAAFHADIASGAHRNVTVVTMSEFGRKVKENSSKGTDHGSGGIMFVMGEKIAGGRVLTQWPGLQADQLFERQDLATTLDARDILAEVVQNRLGNPNLQQVFPNYTPTFRGVTKA